MAERLLVLGAGRHQRRLIQRAEGRGIEVVVADYLLDSPGKAFATHPTMTDMLDAEANIALARKFAVSGVITTGTDQAVVTMAAVAEAVGLPCALTPEAARRATDKAAMKEAYRRVGLPQARYVEAVDAAAAAAAVVEAGLCYPLVIKPADAQGQRGTSRIDSADQLSDAADRALGSSRRGAILIEEFVDGLELTVSVWAEAGEPRVLLVADRITYNPPPSIGICFQHCTPSRESKRLETLRELTRGVMTAYGVSDGPLYIQILARGGDLFIVEGACRVGGGHEASLIPRVIGEDVTDRLIDLALEGRCAPVEAEADPAGLSAAVTFLLADAGDIAGRRGMGSILASGAAAEGEWYVEIGDRCPGMTDGQGRVGYFLSEGSDRDDLQDKVRAAYGELALLDDTGENLMFWPDERRLRG